MPQPEGILPYLADPAVWLLLLALAATAGLLAYRLSGARARRLRQRRAALRRRAGRAASPRERRELMQQWHELGGLHEHRRGERLSAAMEQGRKARGEGRALSANPYGHGLWGTGRSWKRGWQSVDRHIRWIHRQRN